MISVSFLIDSIPVNPPRLQVQQGAPAYSQE